MTVYHRILENLGIYFSTFIVLMALFLAGQFLVRTLRNRRKARRGGETA